MAHTRLILAAFFIVTLLVTVAGASAATGSDFTQCANANPTPNSCDWIGSILQPANSNYSEGMSVPQRLLLKSIPSASGNKHSLTFRVDFTKGGVHAYDFLTAYNQGNSPSFALNPCDDFNPGDTVLCNALRSGPNRSIVSVPDDLFISEEGLTQNRITAYEMQYGDRNITIYSNAPITGAVLTLSHAPSGSGSDTGDSTVHYELNYTSAGTVLLVEFGGHLAVTGNSTIGWGPGQGASFISGGSYHASLDNIDSDSLGSKDNQIQAGFVESAPAGNLTIIKNVINSAGGTAAPDDFTIKVNAFLQNFTFPGQNGTGTTINFLAGSYNVSEIVVPGYSGSFSAGCAGNMADGQTRTCTITNTNVPATLTIIKVVNNTHGGTLDSSSFALFVNGTSVTSGQPVALNTGAYQVSETPIPGYTGEFSGDCDANGLVSLSLGDNKTCTITNSDSAATITVNKRVVNAYGGAKNESEFGLFVGTTEVQNGQPAQFNAGSYVVTETNATGYGAVYSGDCSANGTITVDVGQSKICNITNTDLPATIIVTKIVDNSAGGTATPEDFVLAVTGNDPNPASFFGNGSGTAVTLGAGAYQVNETPMPGYSASFSAGCAGTIANGETKYCNITNSAQQATLTVIKIIINDNGGKLNLSGVQLFIDGTPAENGSIFAITPGLHTVNESPTPGYAQTFSGDCDENGTVALLTGEEKTCTITNDDLPAALVITKVVSNTHGGALQPGDFNISVAGDNANPATFPGNSGIIVTLDAGSYSVSEDARTGYAGTFSPDCSGAVTNGETRYCNITNSDTPAQLTVVKVIINDQGGALQLSNVTLFIDGNVTTNGTPNTVNAGTHFVTEAPIPGYNSVFSGACDNNGTVTLALNQSATCIITNANLPASITVFKQVINDNGGNGSAGDFTLKAIGTNLNTTFTGSEAGATFAIGAGPYSIDEDEAGGYQKSLGSDCSGVIANGEHRNCTIVNDDLPARLIVAKLVNNTHGGAAAASDFILRLNATDASATVFAGNSSGTMITLNAGPYAVSEDRVSGYAADLSADCAGTIANGETKYCIVTNADIAPTLTVIKTVNNTHGGGLEAANFSLFINGTQITSGQNSTLDAGTYQVTEDTAAGYTGMFSGDCDAGGIVTLDVGENKVCYVTNSDHAAFITVVKRVVNDDGGNKSVADFPLHVDNVSVTSDVAVPVNAGEHIVGEMGLAGYNGTIGGDCAANGSVSISVGESKTCTIVNDDIPGTLTVIKLVNNTNGGILGPGDFTLYVNGSQVANGQSNVLDAGAYLVSENSTTGYASSFSGDCDGNGMVTLGLAESKTCYIINQDIAARLTVRKMVINDNGGTLNESEVVLYIDDQQVANGQENAYAAGIHSVSENSAPGYDAGFSGACDENGTVVLQVGDNKTCTITNNDRQASLTVIKLVNNTHGGTLNTSSFTLYVGSTQVASGVPILLNAGAYIVSEANASGYAGSIGGDCAANGTISLHPGDNRTCYITNTDQTATITVVKQVANRYGGTLDASDAELFLNGIHVVSGMPNQVPAGVYIVNETPILGYDAAFIGDCDQNGTLAVSIGESKTCTIVNSDIAPTLTVNKIVRNNHGGTMNATGFTLYVNGVQVVSGETNSFAAGAYVVSENATAGYSGTFSGDCAANGSVTLQVGDSKVCNVTNTDQPAMLTIIKHVVNDDRGDKSASDFPLYVGETLVATGVPATFSAGTYHVTELQQANYRLANYTGACDANGTVSLAPGDDKTCVITNDDLPQVSCEQAVKLGLLTGSIVNGNATVVNMANQSYDVSLVSYNMYAMTIFDQTIFDSESAVIGTGSNASLSIAVPACAYQIEVVCGAPLPSVPDYGNRTIAFDFGEQQNLCVHNQTGNVGLSIAPWYPQGRNYVFACSAQGFNAVSYDWYFGDGQFQFGSANSNTYHTFATDGNYTVQCVASNGSMSGADILRVSASDVALPPVNLTNGTNNTNGTNQTNSTGNEAPQDNTGGQPAPGNVSLSIAPWYPQANNYVFLCDAAGFAPTSYDWYFGDGSALPGVANGNVYHTYLANGSFDVRCYATNGTVSGSDQLLVSLGTNNSVTPPNATVPNGTGQTDQTNGTGTNGTGTNGTGSQTGNHTGDNTGNETGDHTGSGVIGNETGDGNQPSACYSSMQSMPVSCTGGTVTQDTILASGCRSIVCSNGAMGLQVLACDKPGGSGSTHFEMYKQTAAGQEGLVKICLGSTCIQEGGYAKSPDFPICAGNVTPPNTGSNGTNQTGANQTNGTGNGQTGNLSASLGVAPWYPQDNNYVFECAAAGFNAVSYDWHFGDGQSLLGIANSNVYHTFASPGGYLVQCVAHSGTGTNAGASMNITVTPPAT